MRKRKRRKEVSPPGTLQHALLPLARIMIRQGLGVGELIDAVKLAYIQGAMREVIPAGGRINISRLAVATGLTRKEIAGLLGRADRPTIALTPRRMVEQRALRVLRGWSVDPSFRRRDGRPADLYLRGGRRAFPALVKKYGGDVTPVSVLRELERMEAVSYTRGGKLRFHPGVTGSKQHASRRLAEFAAMFRDFAQTIGQVHNSREPPAYFGFKDSTVASSHQAALFHRTFSRRAEALLESIDQWTAHQAGAEDIKTKRAGPRTRVGLGVYLVPQEPAMTPRRINRTRR